MSLRNHRCLSGGFDNNRFTAVLLWAVLLSEPVISAAFARQRGAAMFMAIDFSAQMQIAVVGCALAALLLTGEFRAVLRSVWKTSAGALFLYYLLCVVSSLWSPIPIYTLYRAVEFASMFVIVLIVINRSRDFFGAERCAILLSVLAIACAILANLRIQNYTPSIAIFGGNFVTASAAMIFCYCAGEAPRAHSNRRKFLMVCAALALACVVVSKSSASNIAACCGFVVAIGLLLRSRGKYFLIIGLLLAISFFPLSPVRDFLLPGKTEMEIKTLHGRVHLWEQYTADFIANPILGRGFAVSARMSESYATNTHNSFFAVLSGTGIVGIAVVSMGMARGVRESMKALKARPDGSIGCIAGLTAGLVNSLSAPVFFEQWHLSSVTFASILAMHLFWMVSRVNQPTFGTVPRRWGMGSTRLSGNARPACELTNLQRE